MLTKQQIELVKATVPVLREHGVALTSHFYKRMLSHNPELMQVFNMGHQRAGFQQQALAGAVLAYAENIENLPALLGAVAHIANKHVSVGIRAEHYPIVGKHLIASIKEVLGDAATPELIDAWTAAYMQLADVLIGAEKAIYDKNAVAEGGWTGWRFFKVAEKSKQTDNVTSFKLVPVDNGKMPEVKAGQYISVRVFVKGQDLIQPRQYTVVKADATSLTIAVKKVEAVEKSPAGMVSNTLHNDINEGDVVEVLGDAATPELIDAWTAAYMQLADVLIGAEKAIYDKNAVAEGGWTGWRFFKVAEKSKQTDNVTSFKLVPVDNGKMPEVKAGQYISVRVFVKGQDLIQPRQYTVVKADATSLTIAVKKVEAVEKSPAGMVSNTLHNDINEGDVVEVSFPVGEFNLPEGNGELCLLSAGIGITPLFAMLKEAVQKDPTRKISFVHVCKNKEAIPFREELALVVKEGNASFEVFETSEHGRPSEDFFKSLVSQGADYCICGPVPFMKLAASELVKNGVAENKIHAEKFGTGAI